MNEISPVKRASNVFAWIGFGISLAVFLMVWGINTIVLTTSNVGSMFASLYMMLFLVGSFLGVLGFVFSIVGLIISCRRYLPKWPGVIGIVLCCLSIVSVFVPFVIAMNKSRTLEINNESSTMSGRFPPKPTSYNEFQQVVDFFDSISKGNIMMHSRIMYNLTEEDREEYITFKLNSNSIPFSETWIFQNWEDKVKYLYEDYELHWEKFEYSISVSSGL